MALVAPVENGKVVEKETSASAKSSKAEASSTSGLDKEAFLQLLVAQMQYQDPLEPMDNTEYISQLATFSQLEATQNLADTVSQGMANSLVGKYVFLDVTDKLGNVSTIAGKVDYVMYEGGEVYLAVNDGLYSLADLNTVADGAYYEAFELASVFSAAIAKLPSVNAVTKSDAEAVKNARAMYDAMNSYQKGFVQEKDLEKLEALEKKLKEILPPEDDSSGDKGEGDDKVDADDKDDKLSDG
ncbi:MAG: flagellar hook capping protein [Eubacterium sp.]|jgi:flagellar basal-body rod modification protein FlgD|nr:flagellar hook capping protein [Eubacterium sp.]NBI85832.1 flagellar hook capping protein [Lachnospiraceae bacterium]